jgi:hypothetical protein
MNGPSDAVGRAEEEDGKKPGTLLRTPSSFFPRPRDDDDDAAVAERESIAVER